MSDSDQGVDVEFRLPTLPPDTVHALDDLKEQERADRVTLDMNATIQLMREIKAGETYLNQLLDQETALKKQQQELATKEAKEAKKMRRSQRGSKSQRGSNITTPLMPLSKSQRGSNITTPLMPPSDGNTATLPQKMMRSGSDANEGTPVPRPPLDPFLSDGSGLGVQMGVEPRLTSTDLTGSLGAFSHSQASTLPPEKEGKPWLPDSLGVSPLSTPPKGQQVEGPSGARHPPKAQKVEGPSGARPPPKTQKVEGPSGVGAVKMTSHQRALAKMPKSRYHYTWKPPPVRKKKPYAVGQLKHTAKDRMSRRGQLKPSMVATMTSQGAQLVSTLVPSATQHSPGVIRPMPQDSRGLPPPPRPVAAHCEGEDEPALLGVSNTRLRPELQSAYLRTLKSQRDPRMKSDPQQPHHGGKAGTGSLPPIAVPSFQGKRLLPAECYLSASETSLDLEALGANSPARRSAAEEVDPEYFVNLGGRQHHPTGTLPRLASGSAIIGEVHGTAAELQQALAIMAAHEEGEEYEQDGDYKDEEDDYAPGEEQIQMPLLSDAVVTDTDEGDGTGPMILGVIDPCSLPSLSEGAGDDDDEEEEEEEEEEDYEDEDDDYLYEPYVDHQEEDVLVPNPDDDLDDATFYYSIPEDTSPRQHGNELYSSTSSSDAARDVKDQESDDTDHKKASETQTGTEVQKAEDGSDYIANSAIAPPVPADWVMIVSDPMLDPPLAAHEDMVYRCLLSRASTKSTKASEWRAKSNSLSLSPTSDGVGGSTRQKTTINISESRMQKSRTGYERPPVLSLRERQKLQEEAKRKVQLEELDKKKQLTSLRRGFIEALEEEVAMIEGDPRLPPEAVNKKEGSLLSDAMKVALNRLHQPPSLVPMKGPKNEDRTKPTPKPMPTVPTVPTSVRLQQAHPHRLRDCTRSGVVASPTKLEGQNYAPHAPPLSPPRATVSAQSPRTTKTISIKAMSSIRRPGEKTMQAKRETSGLMKLLQTDV